jgi:MFS family permease
MYNTRRLLRTLIVANFFLYLGFNLWQAVFNNFAVEELAVGAKQIGLIQSIREVPGLMGFVLGFLAMVVSETRIMGLSILLTGVGLLITGGAHNLAVLLVGTTVMSIGFHFFYPSSSSLVLMAAKKEDAPKVLGLLGSVAAVAAVVGTLAVWIFVDGVQFGPLNIPAWGYRNTLYVTGAVVVIGSLFSLGNGHQPAAQRQKRKVIFRRNYWLYYVLTFLMGCRRHIFTTFAIFLLVQVYGIDVRQTAMLFLVNNLINTYTAAQLGRLVARYGERKILTVNFVGLIGVFLGYAYIPYLLVLYVLFVMDNIFFGFSLAVDSYFQKIARSSEEITSNVSMAQTINHISALVVPILGGILWVRISPSATFLAGVVIVLIALALVQLIRAEPASAPLPVLVE